MTHPTTDRLYDAIGPGITGLDPDGILLSWLDGAGSLLGEVDDIVRDTDDGLGWSREFHPTFMTHPRWTGQLLGVQVPDGLHDLSARALVRDRPAFRRGTVPAMIAAAQASLTGSRYVNVIERDGSPYRVRVQVFTDETPEPAVTEAAVRAQKPAGLILTFQVVTSSSYSALEAQPSQTYTALEAETAETYTALES